VRIAYLSGDGSTDTVSSSSARAPLSRWPSDIPLLAVEQELQVYPEELLPNLWVISAGIAVGISAAFILNNIKNIIRN
jgi:hypothetical protein